jgi:hypothetical protein
VVVRPGVLQNSSVSAVALPAITFTLSEYPVRTYFRILPPLIAANLIVWVPYGIGGLADVQV